jgi:hypothetical protein
MDFFNSLSNPAFAPFLGAIAVVLVVFLTEVALTVLAGVGFSDLVEALISADSLPDTSFTNWLLVREVPMLIAILAFLSGFGAFGLAFQGFFLHFFETAVSGFVSVPLAALFGTLCVRYLTLGVTKLGLVGTTALAPEEFIGQRVVLGSPSASKDYAGEASFTDRHSQTHYVMVEPIGDSDVFLQGDLLVIHSQVSASLYLAKKPE